MLFTKQASKYAVAFLLVAFLASCGGASKKEEEAVELTPEQIRIMELVKFGPDPYEAKAPVVLPEAVTEFDLIMKQLAAGDEAGAEVQLKAIAEKYPELSGALYNLGVMEKKRGNIESAKGYLNSAIDRNTNNLNARNLRALIYRDEGNFSEAEKEYLEIIKIWGGYLTAYKNLGILYDLYMGKFEEALPYYKKYNALVPEADKQVSGWIVDIERRLATMPSTN
jgi:tetratricopeptide (TPR) repeat protein